MKPLILLSCLAVMVSGVYGGAYGADQKSRYMILGPGAYLCGTIIINLHEAAKHKDPLAQISYEHWLAGYLTAYNKSAGDTYSILGDTEFKDAFRSVLRYCQLHPRAIFAASVEAYIKETRPDRLRSMPIASSKASSKEKGDDEDDKDE